MTSLDMLAAARKRDWAALPWQFMGAGIVFSLLALLLTRILRTEPDAGRILLLTSSVLCAGIALAIRLNTIGPAFLDRVIGRSRTALLAILAGLFLLLALAAVGILVASFLDIHGFPWGTGTAVYLCVVVVPLSLATAHRAVQLARSERSITAPEESALLLLLTALCCFAGCWTLFVPDDPHSWETIRMVLAVATAAAIIAAPLALASLRVRRWTVSVLVALHFSAILHATLAAPPYPWLIGQMWTRIYRPYLEFMYLNNAYHFYAPEPGPASYLWCRLIYEDKDGKQTGDWFKVPKVDDKTGQHQHSVALEYQRHISMTANIDYVEPTAFINEVTRELVPFYVERQRCAQLQPIVGKTTPSLIVPFHQALAVTQQYAKPNGYARQLISSYVRHVAKLHEEHPVYGKLKWIKAYRVRHDVPPVEYFAKSDPPLEANDPWTYRAFYVGRFRPDGVIMDDGQFQESDGRRIPPDPFLYWLLPVERRMTKDAGYASYDYCRLHAGDPKWIRPPDSDEWVDERHVRFELPQDEKPAVPQPGAP
jgi:hypothetical protein